jgi:hypothetical protein
LYFTALTPTAAQLAMCFWKHSMSRSRSGLLPSMMAGRSTVSTCDELRNGSHIIASVIFAPSHRSRTFASSSTVQ